MNNIAVTGASGFVGTSLCRELSKRGKTVRPIYRKETGVELGSNTIIIPSINSVTNWKTALSSVETVIHCAAHVHQMGPGKKDSKEMYNTVNVDGTLRLAEEASFYGVKRLIYISSIKAIGEKTSKDLPFSTLTKEEPMDLYGKSKLAAEKGLWSISKKTDLEIVILRPPIIYGPGVGANFKKLMTLIRYQIPIPFKLVDNQRSLVGIDNLLDLLIKCVDCDDAPGNTFLISDDNDLSTPELIKTISRYMQRKPKIFPIPLAIIKFIAKILKKEDLIERLCGSLRVDISNTKDILQWEPPYSVDHQIKRTVSDFLSNQGENI